GWIQEGEHVDECNIMKSSELNMQSQTKSSDLQEHPATEILNIPAQSQFENTTKSAHTYGGMTLERTRTDVVDFAADKVT
nr:hypothetical protein [Tanacetum cinerariifolium]